LLNISGFEYHARNINFSIGHTMLVHPDDTSRFKELNVFANTFAAKNAIPDEIAEANVLATMVNGKIVHGEAVDWDPPGDPVQFELWD